MIECICIQPVKLFLKQRCAIIPSEMLVQNSNGLCKLELVLEIKKTFVGFWICDEV